MNTDLSDAGGVTRVTKKVFVSDSGAVVRKIKKIWVSDSGAISRLVYKSQDTLVMITGSVGNTNGYSIGAFGTMTPDTLGDGATVTQLAVSNNSAPTPGILLFDIDTYPGTITSSYLTSLQVGATTYLPAAATFTGGGIGGSAQWKWTGATVFGGGGGSITVIVIRS
jgi:hypothetical protein